MNLTVHLIGGAVRALPPWSCGNRAFRRAAGIPVFLHCAGSGRGGSTVFSAGACGARAAARSCGNRIFRRASWAFLYSCIVPVPVRGQYRVLCRSLRCCLSFCPGLRRPLCRPGFPSARSVPLPAMWGSTGFSAWAYGVACHFVRTCGSALGIQFWFMCTLCRPVVRQPDISAGSWTSLYPCAVPVPAGVAVPCSLPGLVAHALPPGRAATGDFGGQLDIPVSLCCAGSGRGGSTVFSAGGVAPIMPPGLSVRPQCAFARHVGQHRVLCLGLRHPLCRPVPWHFSPVKVP